jgi:hypothetical protein
MTIDQCPWEAFRPAILHFCEAELCAWIKTPANAFSSLAYVAVGAFVLFKEKRQAITAVRILGIVGIMVGITSFLYHSSMTFFAEVMDLGSMFLLSSTALLLNLIRLNWMRLEKWAAAYGALISFSVLVIIFTPVRGIDVFAVQLVVMGLLELKLLLRDGYKKTSYFYWLLAVGAFFVSYAIWLLDYHRVVCSPDNHFLQGHAFWHIINSSAFLLGYRFYHQFPAFQRKIADL